MRPIGVVLRKELRDNLRDRRSVTSALLMPLLGAVMFVVTTSTIAKTEGTDRPLIVPVVGAERAPNLVAFLRRTGAEVVPPRPTSSARCRTASSISC